MLPDRGFSAGLEPGQPSQSASGAPHPQALAREEEFRLVQRLFLAQAVKRLTVLFAAVEHQHDESAVICARAAEMLAAQVEGPVCLVDANLRAPSLHYRYGKEAAVGLADALHDNGSTFDCAPQPVAGNLWLLPSGWTVPDPYRIVTSDRVRFLFRQLQERFDYVLICGAPIGQCAESIYLSQLTDGVVLVVEAHKTRRERARKVKESLDSARVRLLGVVLNNRTFPIPQALYRRFY
jgi:Mrp family chromosome partitioning ATPase